MLAAKWCDRIITVSESDKKLALRYHIARPAKFSVIHNGVHNIEPELLAKMDNDVPVLTMVARIAPPKNFTTLLDSLAHIKKNFLLQVVGDGPDLEKVRSYAHQLGLKNKIVFLGSRTDVAEILAGSDIFILSSDWEGFPICILEGMRAGLPVVASRVGGISEAVRDNVNGYLVPRGDSQRMQTAIEALIGDQKLRQVMGKKSREIYEAEYTSALMIEKVDEIYSRLLKAI
jgi:glycosyltransferase involved in cell wall biosynthesis